MENPINEGAGTVTSDSLAAESTRAGGEFAENRDAEQDGVSSKSSTANTPATSAAPKLAPAPDAESRLDGEERSSSSRSTGSGATNYPEAAGGQAGLDGRQSSGNRIPTAPSYVKADVLDPSMSAKPKGTNLTEGGFDSDDSKNASFTADIGSKDDPGRLAEQKFQRSNADSAPDAGRGPRQKLASGEGQYDTLDADQQA